MELADLVDGDVAAQPVLLIVELALEQAEIGVAPSREQFGDAVLRRHRKPRQIDPRSGRIAQQAQRGGAGEGPFSHAARARQQPCMVQGSTIERTPEIGDGAVLAEQGHSKSPSAASSRAVTSCGLPEASIVRIRVGSASASARKAASTCA